MNPRTHEREQVATVRIARDDGTLERASVGFARRGLFDGTIPGRWGRRKRWEYWAVQSKTHVVSLTLAHLDFVGLASAWLVDLERDERFEVSLPLLPRTMPRFAPVVGTGSLHGAVPGFAFAIDETPTETRLSIDARSMRRRLVAELRVEKPVSHDSLDVLVPFGPRHFQLTSKHVARPASGWATLDGRRIEFPREGECYGTLDHGRGVFPHRTRWNWSAAAGRIGDRTIGWNLGGRWTDGTGVTENGLFVDGRLEKLGADARFHFDARDPRRPWRIATTDGAVDLELVPQHVKQVDALFLPVGAKLALAFGRFRGKLVTEAGETLEVRDHVGWAEEFDARW